MESFSLARCSISHTNRDLQAAHPPTLQKVIYSRSYTSWAIYIAGLWRYIFRLSHRLLSDISLEGALAPYRILAFTEPDPHHLAPCARLFRDAEALYV